MSCSPEYLQGENARMSAFVGAIAIADLVKTTLGPKGMDKILQSVSWILRAMVCIGLILIDFLS